MKKFFNKLNGLNKYNTVMFLILLSLCLMFSGCSKDVTSEYDSSLLTKIYEANSTKYLRDNFDNVKVTLYDNNEVVSYLFLSHDLLDSFVSYNDSNYEYIFDNDSKYISFYKDDIVSDAHDDFDPNQVTKYISSIPDSNEEIIKVEKTGKYLLVETKVSNELNDITYKNIYKYDEINNKILEFNSEIETSHDIKMYLSDKYEYNIDTDKTNDKLLKDVVKVFNEKIKDYFNEEK